MSAAIAPGSCGLLFRPVKLNTERVNRCHPNRLSGSAGAVDSSIVVQVRWGLKEISACIYYKCNIIIITFVRKCEFMIQRKQNVQPRSENLECPTSFQITDAELVVMKTIWNKAPVTANQVV